MHDQEVLPIRKYERFWTPYKPEDTLVHPWQLYKVYPPTVCRALRIGEGTIIGAFCDIGAEVVIGRDCLIQSSCKISNRTVLGDEVFLGPDVNILNDKYMDGRIQQVMVGSGCRIGGGVIILPGVTIGADVFICAGAMITKDVPPETRIIPRSVGDGTVGYGPGWYKSRVVW